MLIRRSVKGLEAQVSQLEAEVERATNAIDGHKMALTEAQHAAKKQLDESSKQLEQKVYWHYICVPRGVNRAPNSLRR